MNQTVSQSQTVHPQPPKNVPSDIKILCVDDEPHMLSLFERTLGRQYQLLTAISAPEAIALIEQNPDIAVILSDYAMPRVNGLEFLKQARPLVPNAVLLILTGNVNLDVAIQAINETDVFRYLPKPCPRDILNSVLNDAIRHHSLLLEKKRLTLELEHSNQQLAESNQALTNQKYLLEFELEMAKAVFSKLDMYQGNTPNGLDYIIHSKDMVGGDFVLTHIDPAHQSAFIMMGDLTGHGLQSALAAMLVTEVFDVLSANDPNVEQLAEGINDKMRRKLPRNLFCAAVLVKLDLKNQEIQIWQGGMPDIFLFHQQSNTVTALASQNLPLGVASNPMLISTAHRFALSDLRSIFVYSDGVIEQRNPEQIMFGYQQLCDAIRRIPPEHNHVQFVMQQLRAHQQNEAQGDDISLFELHLSGLCQALEMA